MIYLGNFFFCVSKCNVDCFLGMDGNEEGNYYLDVVYEYEIKLEVNWFGCIDFNFS